MAVTKRMANAEAVLDLVDLRRNFRQPSGLCDGKCHADTVKSRARFVNTSFHRSPFVIPGDKLGIGVESISEISQEESPSE